MLNAGYFPPPVFSTLIRAENMGVDLWEYTDDMTPALIAAFLDGVDDEIDWTPTLVTAAFPADDIRASRDVLIGIITEAMPQSKAEPDPNDRERVTWLQMSVTYALALGDLGYTHRDVLGMTPRECYALWLAIPEPTTPSDNPAGLIAGAF